MCSLCFLYDFKAVFEHVEDLRGQELIDTTFRRSFDDYVARVEEDSGRSYDRTPEGCLTSIDDADSLLGTLVMTTRMFDLQSRLGSRNA